MIFESTKWICASIVTIIDGISFTTVGTSLARVCFVLIIDDFNTEFLQFVFELPCYFSKCPLMKFLVYFRSVVDVIANAC